MCIKKEVVMLDIFICEDNHIQLKSIKDYIENLITMESIEAKITLATKSPEMILDYLHNNKVAGLYFLDVDLNCKMNGIKLAEEIRSYDPRAFIAFITVDADSLSLTFEYGVEALDYIVKGKDDVNIRIRRCIKKAYSRYYIPKTTPLQNRFVFSYSTGNLKSTKSVPCSEIICFKVSTAPHMIELYVGSVRYEFRKALNSLEKELNNRDNSFFKCSRAAIINIDKISHIDNTKGIVTLDNGVTVDVAAKNIKKIKEIMLKRQK